MHGSQFDLAAFQRVRGKIGALPQKGRQQSARHHQSPADQHRRRGGDAAFLFQLSQAPFQTGAEVIGSAACQLGVDFGVGFASLLLPFELAGAVIPILNFRGQARSDRGGNFVDPPGFAGGDFGGVVGDEMGHGVIDGGCFEVGFEPILAGKVGLDGAELLRFGRAVVEIGRVTGIGGIAIGFALDEMEPLGNHTPFSIGQNNPS